MRRIIGSGRLYCVLAAASFLLLGGCGDGKVKRYPVHGSVNIDGRPAEGVMVIFCPINGSEEVQKLRPAGLTGPDGKFELISITRADGAPVGDYKVLMQWPEKKGVGREGRPELGEDRLQGRYMNLDKTEFKVSVKDGPTDLPPFELKSH